MDRLHPRAQPGELAEDLAKHDAAVISRLDDDTGRLERGGDIGAPGEGPRLAGGGGHLARAIDAVLYRQDRGALAHQRRQQRQGRGVVVGLHRDEDDVDGTDARRVLIGSGADGEAAQPVASDLQTPRADGLQMRATRNEGNVVAGARQLGSVIAADRARTENRESHSFSRLPLRRPYQYTGSPIARKPSPARDSRGRSTSVLSTNAADARMKAAGTHG